jgi:hypothetical protein
MNFGTDMLKEQSDLIASLTKKIKSRSYTPKVSSSSNSKTVAEWIGTDEFNDYVSQSMYNLLARNYLTNLVLAGRLDEETFEQFLTLAGKKDGACMIGVNMMSLCLEVEHQFVVPEEFKMLLEPNSNGIDDTYYN